MNNTLRPTPFGRAMRDAHFQFAPTYNPLNHGSFGTYPRYVQKRFHECQALSEARPDSYVRYDAPRMLDESRAAMASFLGVPMDEVVFVQNASTGTNVVLRSLGFKAGDVVLHLSTLYGSLEKTVEYLREITEVENVNVEVKYPISDDDLVGRFQAAIVKVKNEGRRVKVAVFDTITSMPGVRVPWERLVVVCRAYDVLSMVDAAHGIGQIKVDLKKVQPDFFVSNLHKWLYVPRGCALFYVPKRNQQMIRTTLPTSHGFVPLPRGPGQKQIGNPMPQSGKSPFVSLFEFVATIDTSPYYCVEAALKFRREVCGGEDKIMLYCDQISNEAGKRAADILGTEIMENPEKTLTRCAMTQVRLPLKVGTRKGEISEEDTGKVINWMAFALVRDYDTYASIFLHAQSFWVRFSGQIYLELDDFVRSAHALKELCVRAHDREYLREDSMSDAHSSGPQLVSPRERMRL